MDRNHTNNIPVLQYLKEPVEDITDLYIRYPMGGEYGWFAFVQNVRTFAYWDLDANTWDLLARETGPTAEEALRMYNDFVLNKKFVVDAINTKGGNADVTDSMNKLADEILKIEPAEVSFENNVIIDPYWHKPYEVIAENYDDLYPECMIILFPKNAVNSINLSGAYRYRTYDGAVYDNVPEGGIEHTFNKDADTGKLITGWVIFYHPKPSYFFDTSWAYTLWVMAFSGADPEFISTYNPSIASANHVALYLDSEEVTIGTYSYYSNNAVTVGISDKVKKMTVKSQGFYNLNNPSLIFPEEMDEMEIQTSSFNSNYTIFYKLPLRLRRLTVWNSGFNFPNNMLSGDFYMPRVTEYFRLGYFQNNKYIKRIFFPDSPTLELAITDSYNFGNCFELEYIEIGVVNILNLNQYAFTQYSQVTYSSKLKHVKINTPLTSCIGTGVHAGAFCAVETYEIGDKWNWAGIVTAATLQTVESMIQNLDALADRTGQSRLTWNFGATKLNKLLADPAGADAVARAQAKNWNIV